MADIAVTAAQMRNYRQWSKFNLPTRLLSLYEAIENGVVTSKVMYRDTVDLTIDSNRGCVVVCFDPIDSTGPSGFNTKLMSDLAAAAAAIVVIISFDAADPYSMAVHMAVKSGGIVIVAETVDGAAAQAWLDLAKRPKGDARWFLWSSTPAGRA